MKRVTGIMVCCLPEKVIRMGTTGTLAPGPSRAGDGIQEESNDDANRADPQLSHCGTTLKENAKTNHDPPTASPNAILADHGNPLACHNGTTLDHAANLPY
jgi:hypothetical protein